MGPIGGGAGASVGAIDRAAGEAWFDARGVQYGFKEHVGRGIGTYVGALAAALDTLAGDRVRMVVERGARLAFPLPDRRRVAPPVIAAGDGRITTQFRQHVVLAAWLGLRRPEVVHFAAQTDAPACVAVPSIVTVHDVMLHRASSRPRAGSAAALGFRVARALERSAIRRAARVVVPSRVVAEELASLLDLPVARIAVVPEAAAPRFMPGPVATDVAVRARLGLPARYLLHPGGADPRKRVPALLAVFDRLAASDPALHLVLSGPVLAGGGGGEVRAALASAVHGDRVIATGVLADADLPALMRGAAAVVLATRDEGFGLPVVEAFACGVPVVATAAPAIVEVAAGAARLVPVDRPGDLADAVRDVLDRPAVADDLAGRGRRRAAELSWEANAAAMLRHYEDVGRIRSLARSRT